MIVVCGSHDIASHDPEKQITIQFARLSVKISQLLLNTKRVQILHVTRIV